MSDAQETRTLKLAVIPGDGIGPEVIAEAEKVLDAATVGTGIRFEKTRFSLGAARFLETGDTLTDADLAAIKGHDAILLGAVGGVPGDPRLKDANIERAIAHPGVMIASDGVPFVNGTGHPRGAGTFSRVLGLYSREKGVLPLMEEVFGRQRQRHPLGCLMTT